MTPKSILLTSSIALLGLSIGNAQILDFETSGQFANNFREITVPQGTINQSNGIVSLDMTGTTGPTYIYDTTPGTVDAGTTFAITSGSSFTVSVDFRAATAGSSLAVIFADRSNASVDNNNIMFLFNVDASGTTDRFRFFRDATINATAATAGTQIGSIQDATTTASLNNWATYSVTLDLSGTTPTLTGSVGGTTFSQTYSAGHFDWTNTSVILRLFDAGSVGGTSLDLDNLNLNTAAIPEPAAYSLVAGLGVLGGILARRRRRA